MDKNGSTCKLKINDKICFGIGVILSTWVGLVQSQKDNGTMAVVSVHKLKHKLWRGFLEMCPEWELLEYLKSILIKIGCWYARTAAEISYCVDLKNSNSLE